jgi:hypothetical protein
VPRAPSKRVTQGTQFCQSFVQQFSQALQALNGLNTIFPETDSASNDEPLMSNSNGALWLTIDAAGLTGGTTGGRSESSFGKVMFSK